MCSRGRRTEFTPRTANFADTAYLSRDRWMSSALRTLQNWCKCWKLPIRLAEVRLRHMGSEDDRTGRLGPADHFPNSLFIACPVHALLCKTFGDPSVFQPCRNGGVSKPCTRSYMSRGGLFSGTEGFRTLGSFGLPNARILPKHPRSLPKLDRLKYTKCWHTMASSFLETALCSIMQTLFPSGTTFNINSVTCA